MELQDENQEGRNKGEKKKNSNKEKEIRGRGGYYREVKRKQKKER